MNAPAAPAGKPLVYACSGCSNVAQLANQLAVELDRSGAAQMSCISGVGGGVAALVKLADKICNRDLWDLPWDSERLD